jgi:hypothetical protein
MEFPAVAMRAYAGLPQPQVGENSGGRAVTPLGAARHSPKRGSSAVLVIVAALDYPPKANRSSQ